MRSAVASLGPGLALASRNWRLLVPLWLANLGIGLIAALPLALAALGPRGHQAWLADFPTARWPEVMVGLMGAED